MYNIRTIKDLSIFIVYFHINCLCCRTLYYIIYPWESIRCPNVCVCVWKRKRACVSGDMKQHLKHLFNFPPTNSIISVFLRAGWKFALVLFLHTKVFRVFVFFHSCLIRLLPFRSAQFHSSFRSVENECSNKINSKGQRHGLGKEKLWLGTMKQLSVRATKYKFCLFSSNKSVLSSHINLCFWKRKAEEKTR